MRETLRVANASGYWGDDPGALAGQVRGGALDYVTLDFLAEITMVILQRQRARDPRLGYAYDFVAMLGPVLPEIVQRGIRVVANAGGVHVEACRDRIAEACRAQRLTPALGMVSGDDLLPRLDRLVAAGVPLANLDGGRRLARPSDRAAPLRDRRSRALPDPGRERGFPRPRGDRRGAGPGRGRRRPRHAAPRLAQGHRGLPRRLARRRPGAHLRPRGARESGAPRGDALAPRRLGVRRPAGRPGRLPELLGRRGAGDRAERRRLPRRRARPRAQQGGALRAHHARPGAPGATRARRLRRPAGGAGGVRVLAGARAAGARRTTHRSRARGVACRPRAH